MQIMCFVYPERWGPPKMLASVWEKEKSISPWEVQEQICILAFPPPHPRPPPDFLDPFFPRLDVAGASLSESFFKCT